MLRHLVFSRSLIHELRSQKLPKGVFVLSNLYHESFLVSKIRMFSTGIDQ